MIFAGFSERKFGGANLLVCQANGDGGTAAPPYRRKPADLAKTTHFMANRQEVEVYPMVARVYPMKVSAPPMVAGLHPVKVSGQRLKVGARRLGEMAWRLKVEGQQMKVKARRLGGGVEHLKVLFNPRPDDLEQQDDRTAQMDDGIHPITAPFGTFLQSPAHSHDAMFSNAHGTDSPSVANSFAQIAPVELRSAKS